MIRALVCLWALLGVVTAFASDNWPEFRGVEGDGHSEATGLPLRWSETDNVRWKTPIPGRGWSSPVIWGEQIWLTTATPDGREMRVLCLNRDTGKILLNRKLFDNARVEGVHPTNTYASPSPVIEAGRVYVHYGIYGTACLDTKTFQTLWTRRDLPCAHSVGPGSSPLLAGNLLVLTMDGVDVQYTVALDKKTGKTAWKADRSANLDGFNPEERKSFCTPQLASVGGQAQLISIGAQAAYAYEPRTGKELWRIGIPGYSSASRTLVGQGMVYICTGFNRPELWAVRLGGSGDLSPSQVAWKYARNVPTKPSPLLIGDLLYLVDNSGVMTCLEASTGKQVWKERLGGSCSASPIYADGHIYCFSEDGKATVIQPGRAFLRVAENQLPDGFMASPAVAGKALFLRTEKYLYRIEQ